jgi:hypothetical protein
LDAERAVKWAATMESKKAKSLAIILAGRSVVQTVDLTVDYLDCDRIVNIRNDI